MRDVSVNSETNEVCHRKLVLTSTELQTQWFCYVTGFHFLFRQQREQRLLSYLGRFHPFTGHEGPQGEQMYSSTLFQTSALEGGEGSASRPGSTLLPGKTRYPLYRRLGGPQGRSGQMRKISPHRDSIPGPSSPQAVAIPSTSSYLQNVNM